MLTNYSCEIFIAAKDSYRTVGFSSGFLTNVVTLRTAQLCFKPSSIFLLVLVVEMQAISERLFKKIRLNSAKVIRTPCVPLLGEADCLVAFITHRNMYHCKNSLIVSKQSYQQTH